IPSDSYHLSGNFQQKNIHRDPNNPIARTLNMSDMDDDETTIIQLINLVGQIVHTEKTPLIDGILKKEIAIDPSLPEGTYLLRVIVNDQMFSKQIIYQK
ncbi:MAG: T9SS type A sorting domain-containing protein, partial [Chitinophagales bacterium]